jgi:hypothetical protein
MATRPQIERLTRRIESLVAVRKPARFAVILVDPDETKEAAVERHFRSRPEDRPLERIVVQFVAAKAGRMVGSIPGGPDDAGGRGSCSSF